jgi:hypothetical protein
MRDVHFIRKVTSENMLEHRERNRALLTVCMEDDIGSDLV